MTAPRPRMPLHSPNRCGDSFLLLAVYFQWPPHNPLWEDDPRGTGEVPGNLRGPGVGLHSDWRCECLEAQMTRGGQLSPPGPPKDESKRPMWNLAWSALAACHLPFPCPDTWPLTGVSREHFLNKSVTCKASSRDLSLGILT